MYRPLLLTLALLAGSLPGTLCAQNADLPAPPQTSEIGHGSDYCQRNLGTWFYCDRPEPQAEPAPSGVRAAGPQNSPETDYAAAQQFKADMEKARLVAVWNPTDANVRKYYAFQQETLSKSGTFADIVRRMVWADPALDYTMQRPISAAAKTAWVDTRNTDRDLFFRGVYDEIGIYYIYRGSCAPCRLASPIVAQFGQRYGLTVKAISTDGAPNESFANYVVDRGQLKAWGYEAPVTPAYMIYQRPTLNARGQVRPVAITVSDGRTFSLRPCENPKGCLTYMGAGVLSVDEMADRLFVTLATEPGKDF
jgi:conjugal transfer pilus assembly protein TraF